MPKKKSLLGIIGPGILVAATGVGAGDLATAAFTGNRLGVAVLWAVLVGAFLKYVLNEGLTRWQLATGDTLLEGCVKHLGKLFQWSFLAYLILWSFLVAMALMSACGATMHAILPLRSAPFDKVFYGVIHSLTAVVLVLFGGFRLFERVMTFFIGMMFCVVVLTAVALRPPIGEVISGLFVPRIPMWNEGGLEWTVALLGGVGGTLTILCYGYWIREEERQGTEDLRTCRIDLATGYGMTALFGLSMLVIGSQTLTVEGRGSALLVDLSDGLANSLGRVGPIARWGFLIGAWGAVFSSLLGVWQSIPYLFADFCKMVTKPQAEPRQDRKIDTTSIAYRAYLFGLATIPMIGLYRVSFVNAQKTYAVISALVIPFLAAVLLYLNNRTSLVGDAHRNRWLTNTILGLTLLFFAIAFWLVIKSKFLS